MKIITIGDYGYDDADPQRGEMLMDFGEPTLSCRLHRAGVRYVRQEAAVRFRTEHKHRLLKRRRWEPRVLLAVACLLAAGVPVIARVWVPPKEYGVPLCLALIGLAALCYRLYTQSRTTLLLLERAWRWVDDVGVPLFCLGLETAVKKVEPEAIVKADCFTRLHEPHVYQVWAEHGPYMTCLGVFNAAGQMIDCETSAVLAA